MTIAVALLAAVAASGAAARGVGTNAEGVTTASSTSEAARGAVKAKPSLAERRCRSLAARRLARLRKAAEASGRSRIGRTARSRVRRKLRRCLAVARREAKDPADGPSDPGSPEPGAPSAPGTPGPSLPSFVGVTASDSDGFKLTLSRPAVAAGNVTIELRNIDNGPHDLVVEPEGGGVAVADFDEAGPGAVARKQVALAKGRWYLYCSLPGHEAIGMHATLRAE